MEPRGTIEMVNVMNHKYTVKVDSLGDVVYLRDGILHRDGDKPALIYANGRVVYFKDDKRHRDGDLPAVIHSNGSIGYWRNGERYEP